MLNSVLVHASGFYAIRNKLLLLSEVSRFSKIRVNLCTCSFFRREMIFVQALYEVVLQAEWDPFS